MISRALAQIASQQALIPWMTSISLLIFLTFFLSMLFWTARRANASLYQAMSQMPLQPETGIGKQETILKEVRS